MKNDPSELLFYSINYIEMKLIRRAREPSGHSCPATLFMAHRSETKKNRSICINFLIWLALDRLPIKSNKQAFEADDTFEVE
jgi:hypothetical protein